MENFQCTSIGIGRSTFVVVDGAEYRKQEARRRGMLRSDWVDKCENNQRHLYPPLPSILWCGFQTMMTAINKGDQEDKAMTEATIIDKNNHGLAVCLCWWPQSVCLRLQSVQICNQYKRAADENLSKQFLSRWHLKPVCKKFFYHFVRFAVDKDSKWLTVSLFS